MMRHRYSGLRNVRRGLVSFAVVSSCLLCTTGKADWPMFQKNSHRTGFSYETGILDSVMLRWDWDMPNMLDCLRNVAPVVGDIDRDGRMEIVIAGSSDGTLYVLRDSVHCEDTKLTYHANLVWSYKVSSSLQSSALLFDINDDDTLEVVFGSWNDSVYALNGRGERIWAFGTGALVQSSPGAGDIDNDGHTEVVIGSNDHWVYVLNGSDGSLEWKYETGDCVWSSPAIGDINGDDTLEIIIGSRDHKLYVLHTGDTLWTYETGGRVSSTPTLGDLDGDTVLDVVFGSYDGWVYALRGGDGNLLWSYQTNGNIEYQSAGLADIDKDGKLEVIIGSLDGNRVYVIEGESGVEKWSLDYMSMPVTSSPAIADVDNDGDLEIVMSIHDGYCYAWEADDSEQWRWSYNPVGDQDAPIALTDIDDDSQLEVIGADIVHDRIYVLDMPVPPWGVEEEGDCQWSTGNGQLSMHPNPFTTKTVVNYHLPLINRQPQDNITRYSLHITLAIHDLSGRLVRSFQISKSPNLQIDKLTWDGTNSAGEQVKPGIYFVRVPGCEPMKAIKTGGVK